MKIFTIEYQQPTQYRFSLDSVEAPAVVAQKMQDSGTRLSRVLDVCAGCGVMGLELAAHLNQSLSIDFLEVQSVYEEFFNANVMSMRERDRSIGCDRELKTRFLNLNYRDLKAEEYFEQYDLILANPPYFRKEQGHLSGSEFKNRCRFFLDASEDELWDGIIHALKPGASAFVLIRPLADHKIDPVAELQKRLRYSAQVVRGADIRGTDLIQATKRTV